MKALLSTVARRFLLCTAGIGTSAWGSCKWMCSGTGSLWLMATLWSTAQASIILADVWVAVLSFIERQGNRLFQIPNALSTADLVAMCDALYLKKINDMYTSAIILSLHITLFNKNCIRYFFLKPTSAQLVWLGCALVCKGILAEDTRYLPAISHWLHLCRNGGAVGCCGRS